ncbi:MFS transporter [Altererythrobacter aquiaggeris]|uniref:MFS transporter n=1 Tax=Aestuarierythrobacter aquiaggeris TaxID=1898396 RepID=UPI0030163829
MTDAAAIQTSSGTMREPTQKEIRLVIAASSAGTVFEWYDFFIYGTLYAIISQAFFPSDNATLAVLLTWATFAIGFAFRPIGAILFGYMGDKLGRKYTFLVTVTLMGVATAGVGLIPSAASIGIAAPIIVILLRILQGLALGGEYGGAAIYVAEHAPPEKRGFYTAFIQASVVGGFVLSILVVIVCRMLIPADEFAAWGWRVPFLLSIVLLGISLWMRLKLSESPVFQAMKDAGETAGNPFIESFTYPGNKKRIFVALFGVAGILTVIWYTAFFSGLAFLRGPMRMEDGLVEIIMLIAGSLSMVFYLIVGRWSDKVGRKKPIVVGAVLTLLLLFPVFWGIGALANPGLKTSAREAPVVVSGTACKYDPFAETQSTQCGILLQDLSALGIPYDIAPGGSTSAQAGPTVMTIGGKDNDLSTGTIDWEDSSQRKLTLTRLLETNGYDFSRQTPPLGNIIGIILLLLGMGALSALTYGSVAALLSEMFPPRIRYSSMSIPYHIGAGYLGGFLPLIAGYIVASTGNAYSGLWYTWIVVAFGLLVAVWGLPSGPPTDFADNET